MKNYTNYQISNGGYREIPAAAVKDRVKRFVLRTRNCSPNELKEPWKGLVAYTLVEYCEWDLWDVAEFLQFSQKTAQRRYDEAKRLFRMASFTSKITSNGSKFVSDLQYYIYYNIHRR